MRVPGTGAEDVLIGPKGHVWTGTEDGSIFRLTPDGHLVERVTTTGGRPLGLELLGDGRILVCDADRGLLAVDPASGRVELLLRPGRRSADALLQQRAVAADGRIFFTDSLGALLGPRVEARPRRGDPAPAPTGATHRRLGRDPPDRPRVRQRRGLGRRRVLRRGGRDRGADGGPTLADRCPRRQARLPRTGPLPGCPDNISRGTDGLIWVAIASPTDPVVERLKTGPMVLRRGALKLPAWASQSQKRTARVVALDADGRVVHDRAFEATEFHMATGVRESTAGSGSATSSTPPSPGSSSEGAVLGVRNRRSFG